MYSKFHISELESDITYNCTCVLRVLRQRILIILFFYLVYVLGEYIKVMVV